MDKTSALENALQLPDREFEGETAVRHTPAAAGIRGKAVPTGALSLDIALGLGGVPRGRIVEIYGPAGSGKTTLALHIAAEAQKGGVAAFIDADHALDLAYAKRLGLEADKLLLSRPESGEQALEIVGALVRSGAVDLVVVDSVAALVPKLELERALGAGRAGLHARLMARALRRLAGVVGKTRATAVFVNQLREKPGLPWGNPETTTGGRALKFYAAVRLEMRSVGLLRRGGEIVGSRARVKVVKNKLAPPFRQAEFDIVYGRGICRAGCVLELGRALGLVGQSGGEYVYAGARLGRGLESARAALEADAALCGDIEARICASISPSGARAKERTDAR